MATTALDTSLRPQAAQTLIRAAGQRFGAGLVLAASFQDCVLIDVATRVVPAVEVIFIDTGSHFPETLEFVEAVRQRYDLRLRVVRASPGGCPPCGQSGCCEARKVRPLDRALAGKQAWMSGVRRAESPQRAGTEEMAWDSRRRMFKINPLAEWSDEDVAEYADQHSLLQHPLTDAGYLSIGCAPTTVPVQPGAHPRSGRWPGSDKTECGIHL